MGINTVIIATGQNLGFAVPISMVKEILPSIKEKGRPDMGWLGVSAQMVTPDIAEALGLQEPVGAIINGITKNSPADKAGLKRGDVIMELDGKKILDPSELPRMVAFGHIGKTVIDESDPPGQADGDQGRGGTKAGEVESRSDGVRSA